MKIYMGIYKIEYLFYYSHVGIFITIYFIRKNSKIFINLYKKGGCERYWFCLPSAQKKNNQDKPVKKLYHFVNDV